MTGTTLPAVEFWFDPSCPWAWMTSRWVTEVAEVRGYDVSWNVFSLAVLNEDRDVDPEYAAFFPRALRLTRLIAGVEAEHGKQFVKPLYDALGVRMHPGARDDWDEIIRESVVEVGLPERASELADSLAPDQLMRDSHTRGITLVGQDVGTPIISVDGVAFFGPVVSPAPAGEDALKLWDGIVMAAQVPGFFELKRTRTHGPMFS